MINTLFVPSTWGFCFFTQVRGGVPNLTFFYCRNLFIRLTLGHPENFSLLGGREVLSDTKLDLRLCPCIVLFGKKLHIERIKCPIPGMDVGGWEGGGVTDPFFFLKLFLFGVKLVHPQDFTFL